MRRTPLALQTIKGITLGPWGEKEHTTTTWYEPLTAQADIDTAVGYVLSLQNAFLNTASDLTLLPKVIDAAQRWDGSAPPLAIRRAIERAGMAPLFV